MPNTISNSEVNILEGILNILARPADSSHVFGDTFPVGRVFIGDSMKQIKLTHNKFALVDDANFEWLNQWK